MKRKKLNDLDLINRLKLRLIVIFTGLISLANTSLNCKHPIRVNFIEYAYIPSTPHRQHRLPKSFIETKSEILSTFRRLNDQPNVVQPQCNSTRLQTFKYLRRDLEVLPGDFRVYRESSLRNSEAINRMNPEQFNILCIG